MKIHALSSVCAVTFAFASIGYSQPDQPRVPVEPPPDLEVPSSGWATREPNTSVAVLPDNSWQELAVRFYPEGAKSFADNKFGVDYNKFGHTKGEVGLVYDEASNVTVWFGGCSAGYTNQTLLLSVSDAVWYQAQPEHIDFMTGKHRNAEGRPNGQCSYGACYDPDDQLYIKGMGICSGWPVDKSIWAYDASKNDWKQLGEWKTENTGQAGCYRIVYDRDAKKVILFGGLPMDNNATWTFDVARRRWEKVQVKGASPSGRIYHHMVYDERNKKTVLFGGAGGRWSDRVHLNDTWTFDSTTNAWTEMKPLSSPSPRDRGAISYDSANGVCVLVGGKRGPDVSFEDTWVYDTAKNEWRDMQPARQPPYLGLYQSTYDRINNVTIYVGRGRTYVYRYGTPKAR